MDTIRQTFFKTAIDSDKVAYTQERENAAAFAVQQGVKNSLSIDECGSLSIIDHPHHEIHESCYWFCDDQSEALNSGSVKYYLLITPNENNFMHSFPNFYGTGEFEVQTYEGVTVATNGTELPLLNRNRTSGASTTFKFYKDPTSMDTTGSVKLRDIRVGSGKAVGDSRSENELILKKNTLYGIKITSRASSVIISTHINGYICGIGG